MTSKFENGITIEKAFSSFRRCYQFLLESIVASQNCRLNVINLTLLAVPDHGSDIFR
jgi:hypothetical protein